MKGQTVSWNKIKALFEDKDVVNKSKLYAWASAENEGGLFVYARVLVISELMLCWNFLLTFLSILLCMLSLELYHMDKTW